MTSSLLTSLSLSLSSFDSHLSSVLSPLDFPLPLLPFGYYFRGFLFFVILVSLFEFFLDLRQYAKFFISSRPKDLKYLSDKEFNAAQQYGKEKMKFNFVSEVFATIKLSIVLTMEFYPYMWRQAEKVIGMGMENGDYSNEYSITMVYVTMDMLIDLLLSLPFSIYFTFILEKKFGFNKTTVGTFVLDTIKSLFLQIILGGILISFFIFIISNTGKIFYFYCWMALLAVQIIGILIYPTIIQPLFNKVETLQEGELRRDIEEMAQRVHFPLTEIYTIDGSKRSSHSNAYQYGFGKMKRIVIFDTLCEQCDNKQIVAILCHELGHSILSHTMKNFFIISIQSFVMFFLFGKTIGNLQIYEEFGFHFPSSTTHSPPVYIGFLLFQLLYSPIQHVTSFLMNVMSRRFEFAADAFSVQMGMGKYLREGLIVISKENKSTPIVDHLYSTYHHSHPPLLHRLKHIDTLISQTQSKNVHDDNGNPTTGGSRKHPKSKHS